MEESVMGFYDNLDSLQSQMLSYLIDYARGGNYHPLIKYKREEDMLYFKNYDNEWVDEYNVDIWFVAEVADSVSSRKILVDMACDDRYLDCIEYDERNDTLILKLNDKETTEDECPWALVNILETILSNNKQNN